MATVGVDFFRVDRARAVRRLLAVAAALVTVGATTIGAHLVQRLSAHTGRLLSLVGGAITLSGLVLGFGSLAMLLFENVYILFTAEALVLHENGKETRIAWDDLAAVKVGEKGFLVIERATGSLPWFVGAPAAEIATKITEARRKALLGLLRG